VSTIAAFHGPNLERWLMKTLCGFVVARPTIFPRDQVANPVHAEWVRYLFGQAELTAPAGVYVSPTLGESRPVDPAGLRFTSLHARNQLSGIMVDMRILRFTFISIPWQSMIRGVLNDQSIRRPWRVNIGSQRAEWCLDFGWPNTSGPEARFRLDFGAAPA
jgi:hypothetical protein